MDIRGSVAIALAVALMVVSGCGDDDRDAGTPVIDISKLDSGNYPAVPRDVEKTRTPQTGAALEAVRISNAMPLAFEIDGRYAYQRLLFPERRATESTRPEIYSLSPEEIQELAAGYVAGADTSAERRKIAPLISSSVAMTTLRFPDPAQAEAAVRRLADRQAMNLAGAALQIPGFPQARAKWSDSKKYLDAWLTHNALILYVHIGDPLNEPSDTTALAELTKHAFTALVDRLAGYVPTPAEQLGSLPIDADGLLSRTLPWDAQRQRNKAWDQSAAMPPQAALHFDTSPALTKAAFDDAGVDLVAYSESKVYRTRDSASAARLISALKDQRSEGWEPTDAPPNMPGVQCLTTKPKISNSDRYPPSCFLAYDRFVAQVTGKNAQDLHQKAAAQYKLLAYKP